MEKPTTRAGRTSTLKRKSLPAPLPEPIFTGLHEASGLGGEDSDTAAQPGRLSGRNPRTTTLNQLLDRYLAVLELEESTRKAYMGYLEVHVRSGAGGGISRAIGLRLAAECYTRRRVLFLSTT